MENFHNIANLGNERFDGREIYTGFAARAFWHIEKTDGATGSRAYEARWFYGQTNIVLSFYASSLAEASKELERIAARAKA